MGTPQPVVNKIYGAVVTMSKKPELVAQLAKAQINLQVLSPEDTAQKLAALGEFFAAAAKRSQPK